MNVENFRYFIDTDLRSFLEEMDRSTFRGCPDTRYVVDFMLEDLSKNLYCMHRLDGVGMTRRVAEYFPEFEEIMGFTIWMAI